MYPEESERKILIIDRKPSCNERLENGFFERQEMTKILRWKHVFQKSKSKKMLTYRLI